MKESLPKKIKSALKMEGVPPVARRTVVAVVGGTVLLTGVALIVLPGPAFVVIPLGLAILASEFAWAKHYVNRARKAAKAVKEKITGNNPPA